MKTGNVIQSKYNEAEKYIIIHEERGRDGKLRDFGYLLVSMSTGKVIESYAFLEQIKKGVLGEGSETLFNQKYDVFELDDLIFEEVYTKRVTKESVASSIEIGNSGGEFQIPKMKNVSSTSSKYAGIKGCKYSIGDRVESMQFSFEHGIVTGIKYSTGAGWLMQVDEGGWYADGWVSHLSNSPKHEVPLRK